MIPVGTNLRLKNTPWVTCAILALNWLIFLFSSGFQFDIQYWIHRYMLAIPGEQYPWQLITSMFFHADIYHIIGNSVFLAAFGPTVEDKLGWKTYIFFYLLTGIAGNIVHSAVTGLFMRDDLFVPGLGASGAISGIMGVYLYRCYYSKVKFMVSLFLPFIPPLKIPAVVILSLWFLKDLIGGIGAIRGESERVAFWAHVGGFAAGFGACGYLRYEIQAKREKLAFVVEREQDQFGGTGKVIEACEKLLKDDPRNPEWHLRMAQALGRLTSPPQAKEHYLEAIKLLLGKNPDQAVDVFVEYWKKYLSPMEPRY